MEASGALQHLICTSDAYTHGPRTISTKMPPKHAGTPLIVASIAHCGRGAHHAPPDPCDGLLLFLHVCLHRISAIGLVSEFHGLVWISQLSIKSH